MKSNSEIFDEVPAAAPDSGKNRALDGSCSQTDDLAAERIAALESVTGNRLTPRLRRLADEYARDQLGDIEFARFLYDYCVIYGGFEEGWLTYQYFRKILVKPGGIGLEKLSKIKTFSNLILKTDAMPDIGYYLHGRFYDREMRPATLESLKQILREVKSEEVYVKPDGSVLGESIYRVSLETLDDAFFTEKRNAVIQCAVTQHASFEDIVSDSLATIRILTGRTVSGDIKPMAAYVRFGMTGTQWIVSSQCVRVAIVDAAGTLDECGYTSDWKSWRQHPNTGASFAGRTVPLFAEAIEFCLALHRSVPHPILVGWDIAVDAEAQLKLLEWNADHCEIRFSEAVSGPCFAGLRWQVSDHQQRQRCRHLLVNADDEPVTGPASEQPVSFNPENS